MFGLFKNNRQQEFLDLVEANQGIILKICRLYTKSNMDFEDLYQEILTQAWQSYSSFKGKSKFSTWLYKVSLNTALTSIRKRNIDRVTGSLNHPQVQELKSIKVDYDQKDLIEKAIALLSDGDKAFLLLYLDGYSYEEISEMMGCTVNHTGVKINRIKSKIKEIVSNEEIKTSMYGK